MSPIGIGRGVGQDNRFSRPSACEFAEKFNNEFVNQASRIRRVAENFSKPVMLESVVVFREEIFRADNVIRFGGRGGVKVNFAENVTNGFNDGGRRVPFDAAGVVCDVRFSFVHNFSSLRKVF